LTIVIDRRGGSGRVVGEQREFVDLIWRTETPHSWAKLEHLFAATPVVMNAILRPPDYLTQVIGSRGKAVISTRKCGQSPHLALALFPNEPEVDKADVVRRSVEIHTTPVLAVRLRIGSLRNTHDNARGIFHVPCDTTVGSPERVEIG
jgi:hypothetical protein